jgi:PAS domain S-box-containing protein
MACKMFGATYNDFIGKTPFDLSPKYQPDGESSEKKGKEILNEVFKKGVVDFEWLHKKANGESFLAKISASSFKSNGKYYAAVSMLDITIAVQEQQELLNYKLKLEQLVEEKTLHLDQSNQELQALNEELDTSNEELSALNEELNSTNEELEQTNLSLQNEILEHKKTQAERENYRMQLEILLEQKTERLAQVTERFAEIYSNTSDAITFLDVIFDDRLVLKVFEMNAVAQNLFSVNTEQIEKGVFATDFIPKTNYEAFLENILPPLLAGNTVTIKEETELSIGYWQSTIVPIKDNNGKVYRIVIFSKDITAEHEREKTLAILQSAIDSWPFEFWARDNEGRQILQNKASRERTGNLIGKKLEDVDMPDEVKRLAKQLKNRVLAGENVSIDFESMVSGQKRYLIYNLNPIITNKIIGYTSIAIDITDRKLAENALRESEERFRRIARLSKNLVYDYDLKSNKIYWDGAIEEVTGYNVNDYKNVGFEQWIEMVHPDDKDLTLKLFQESLTNLKPYQAQYRYKNKYNQYRWIEEDTHIIVATDNTPVKYLGVMKDITERKESEGKIRQSEEQYRLLAENIDDVISKMDIKTLRYTYFSPSVFKLTGYLVEEVLKLSLEQFLMPDSLKELTIALPVWFSQFNNGEPDSKSRTFEYQLRHKSGFPVWVEINATLVKDSSGAIKEIVATCRSIEERKSSELSLRKSEDRYNLVTELSGYMVYDYDLINQHVDWAGAVQQLTGFTNKELGENMAGLINLIHPEDRHIVSRNFVTEKNSIRNSSYQFRCLTKNKGYVWVETIAFLFTDDQNIQYRWLGIMRDITEQLRIQLLIKESEEKLKTIFNATKDGIVLLNKDMKIFDINNSALKRSGYTREEIVGKDIIGFLIKNAPSSIAQHILSIWEKDVIDNFETEVIIKNEGSFPVEISATALPIDKQNMLLLMIRDISERKLLEKKLLHSVIDTEEKERIHFSQELHDGLGPLLSAAKMYAEWLAEPGPDVDPKVIVTDMQKLLDESTQTVKDISFKLSPHILQNYGVVEALKAYAEKSKKSGKTDIVINATNISRFDEIIETIIYRVICECINNSLKHAKASNISVSLKMIDNILYADFSDDGIGFDVNTVSEKHKGIGLLNIQSRLKSINGQFSIQSAIGNGTKILIKVPLYA